MSLSIFEIRICQSCGLRYPLAEGNSFGVRCPRCLGETVVVLRRQFGGDEQAGEERKKAGKTRAVLLDNIRSAWNVGSILRSADGFGVDHAYLCGITPTPEVDAVRKIALGSDGFVTWSQHKDAVKLVKSLKLEGWKIVALEDDGRSKPISQFADSQSPNPVGVIVGSEVTGIDPGLLDLADEIFHIPMRGRKRSFNVAVAFGVAAFSLFAAT